MSQPEGHQDDGNRVPALTDPAKRLIKLVAPRPPGFWRRARFAYEMAAPRRYLFVMSHMRSYSTLLCHILNTNPAIDGYVEMHSRYTKELDLLELALRIRSMTGQPLKGRYVVDKVLHNYHIQNEILRRRDVYGIFSIRHPQRTIPSTLAMGLRRKKLDWKSDPEKVVNHYRRRLRRMTEQAKMMRKRSLFFEAELIVDDTERLLAAMTDFLGLDTPLRPQYEISAMTGRTKWGDGSQFIRSGDIVRERDEYDTIEVPDHLMAKATRAYDDARAKLTRYCTVTVSAESATERSRQSEPAS